MYPNGNGMILAPTYPPEFTYGNSCTYHTQYHKYRKKKNFKIKKFQSFGD